MGGVTVRDVDVSSISVLTIIHALGMKLWEEEEWMDKRTI